MVDAACSEGAARVTVADVVSRAGVSRRTFYETFVNVEECLQAAIDLALEVARGYMRAAYDPSAPWPAQMRAGIEAFLSFLQTEPGMGRLLVVEWLAAGPKALEHRAQTLAPIVAEIDRGSASGRAGGLSELTAEGLVGSVLAVLHARLTQRRRGSLLALSAPLTAMVVRPYLGAAAARRELARPPVRHPRRASPLVQIDRRGELPMRMTYRTMRMLIAVGEHPASSNRSLGDRAGISDQGQASKLLQRLQRLGLVENRGSPPGAGAPNAWALTPRGVEIHRSIAGYASQE